MTAPQSSESVADLRPEHPVAPPSRSLGGTDANDGSIWGAGTASSIGGWQHADGELERLALESYRRAHTQDELQFAGVVRRGAGLLIDIVAVSLLLGVVSTVWVFGAKVLIPLPRIAPDWQLALAISGIVAIDVAIWVWRIPLRFGRSGATFGMKAVGVAAVDPQTRVPVGVAVSFLRIIALVVLSAMSLGGAALVVSLAVLTGPHEWWTWWGAAAAALAVGFSPQLWALFDSRRQTLADRITRTVVVLA